MGWDGMGWDWEGEREGWGGCGLKIMGGEGKRREEMGLGEGKVGAVERGRFDRRNSFHMVVFEGLEEWE